MSTQIANITPTRTVGVILCLTHKKYVYEVARHYEGFYRQ